VPSNFDCIGLGVADGAAFRALIERLVQDAVLIGSRDGCDVLRWQDDCGARVGIGIVDGVIVDVVPSFAAPTGVATGQMTRLNDEIWRADVVDADGEVVTAMAVDLEERRLAGPGPRVGDLGVIAFGWGLAAFEDADAYGRDDASLLQADDAGSPPPADLAEGITWPPRMAAESFISYGLFAEGDPAPVAHLAGTVLDASTRTNPATGQAFHVARLRTVPGEIVACVPAVAWDLPRAGQVLAGRAYMVATLATIPPEAAPRRRRGWFGRRGS